MSRYHSILAEKVSLTNSTNHVFVLVSLLFVFALPLVLLLQRGHVAEDGEIIAD